MNIKLLIVVFVVFCSLNVKAQVDTAQKTFGYIKYDTAFKNSIAYKNITIVPRYYPEVYVDVINDSILVRIDTVHHKAQVHNHYKEHCMYFQVDDNPPQMVLRNDVFTVWSDHFTLIVSRKNYSRTYKF